MSIFVYKIAILREYIQHYKEPLEPPRHFEMTQPSIIREELQVVS